MSYQDALANKICTRCRKRPAAFLAACCAECQAKVNRSKSVRRMRAVRWKWAVTASTLKYRPFRDIPPVRQ